MSMLTIEGFDVPVADAPVDRQPWGDIAPAFSGVMRSDVRARHRTLRITTAEMEDEDALALWLILASPGPLRCSGPIVDYNLGVAETDCHAPNTRRRWITATDSVISFELRETGTEQPTLLFGFQGDAPGPYSFDRTGAAESVDEDGLLISVAEDVARFPYQFEDGVVTATRALRMERTATNLVTSDNFDSGWTSVGAVSVASGIDDPAGGTGAYRIEDDTGGAIEYKALVTGFTGDGVKSVVFVVREQTMASSGVQELAVRQTSGTPATQLSLEISAWVDGEPTVAATTGTLLGKRALDGGWWAIDAQTASITAAETNELRVIPAATASATGVIDVYRANAYDLANPPWSILNASQVLGAEYWNAAHTHTPVAATLYVKFRELSEPNWVDAGSSAPRILQIGTGGSYIVLFKTTGAATYAAEFDADSAGAVSRTVSLTPARGDLIELRVHLSSAGALTLGGSKAAATEVVSSQSSAIGLPAAWGDALLRLGSLSASAGQGDVEIITAFMVRGERSMAACRKIASARLHRRAA